MIVAQDLLNRDGKLLLSKGQSINCFHISKMKSLGYSGLYINDESANLIPDNSKICTNKRVLVVDDSLYMRKLISSILTKNDFTVAGEAENGDIAILKYAELRPDIVTMDITMPVLDGIGALEK